MIALQAGGELQERSDFQYQHRYEALGQRREALLGEISAIYRRYDEHIGSRLQTAADCRGFLDLDAMPSDEEYAAYDLANTPLSALEEQLFKVSVAMQDLRLTGQNPQ